MNLFDEIDFSKEIARNKALEPFIKQVAGEVSKTLNPVAHKKPFLNDDVNNVIISNFSSLIFFIALVTGLPNAQKGKQLQTIEFILVEKILKKYGLNKEYKELIFGFNKETDEKINGTCLMTFKSFELAKQAAQDLDNIKIPPKNRLKCYHISDYHNAMKQEEYKAPKFLTKDQVQGYFTDDRHRDQILFPIQIKKQGVLSMDAYVNWFNYQDKAMIDIRQISNETGDHQLYYTQFPKLEKLSWSENGGYLAATFSSEVQTTKLDKKVSRVQGFHLFGGEKLEYISTFYHPYIKKLKFSPCEKYILSYNGVADQTTDNFIVWEIATSSEIRKFRSDSAADFENFQWSFDGKYIATLGRDILNVYELPSMNLIKDKKTGKKQPILVYNIRTFVWAPNSYNILYGCFSPARGNKTETKSAMANRIALYNIETRISKQWKNFKQWRVNKITLYFSKDGKFATALIRKLKRLQKNSFSLQICNLQKRDLEFSTLEIEDNLKELSLSPSGKKLALVFETEITTRSEDESKVHILRDFKFYNIQEQKKKRTFSFLSIGSFTTRSVEIIKWSSNEKFFLIYSPKGGDIEFFFIQQRRNELIVDQFGSDSLEQLTSVEYDPSGRFALGYLKMENKLNTYALWNCYGQHLTKDKVQCLQEPLWRPRVNMVKDQSNVTKNSKFYKIYDEEDDKIINTAKWKAKQVRKEKIVKYEKYLVDNDKDWKKIEQFQAKLIGKISDDQLLNSFYFVIEDQTEVDQPEEKKKR